MLLKIIQDYLQITKEFMLIKTILNPVITNGAIPLIIPITLDIDTLKTLVNTVDAIILSGGHDVFPYNYGSEPQPKLGEVFLYVMNMI